jgi:two-component system sensor histidine kinase VicK
MSLASHELKAPLIVIKGYLTELTEETAGKLTKEQRKFIDITINASDKLLRLANELLEVARFEEGRVKTEPIVVNPIELSERAITRELQQPFKQKKQKFTFEKPKSLPKIKVDPKFIMVPIQNLLSNASKYTPEKGTIKFKISQGDNRIIFQITDSGIGIPPEEQFKVFQRFFRASNATHLEKGTGLGLYMTKLMIELSGGRIWFKSEKNKGTTFYFSLPVFG